MWGIGWTHSSQNSVPCTPGCWTMRNSDGIKVAWSPCKGDACTHNHTHWVCVLHMHICTLCWHHPGWVASDGVPTLWLLDSFCLLTSYKKEMSLWHGKPGPISLHKSMQNGPTVCAKQQACTTNLPAPHTHGAESVRCLNFALCLEWFQALAGGCRAVGLT